jgi:hypothetical protein
MKTSFKMRLLLLLLLALPTVVQAQFSFSTNADNTLAVIGYSGPGGDVVIPSTFNGVAVTIIGTNAFQGNSSITNVVISTNVTAIDDRAFTSCTSLTGVIIPNSVTNVGEFAFDDCTSLTNLEIGNAITRINTEVFRGCSSLTTVIIPNGVTNIGLGAFYDDPALETVAVGSGVVNIGNQAFGGSFGGSPGGSLNYVSFYFQGNAPISVGSNIFARGGYEDSEVLAIVYVPLGATGWAGGIDGVSVTVVGPESTPPSITAQPQHDLVSAYSSATFTVTGYGSLPLTYQWCLNGTNVFGATDGALTVSNVDQSDLGQYTVVVGNSFGSITSSPALLEMYPFIEDPFSGLDTYWGQTNTLSVGAWGTGPLDYQWLLNGVAITGATNQTLTLSGIQFTNAGLYTVVVSSQFGSVTNTPEQVIVNPANVTLRLVPDIVIEGTVGYSYIIQSTTDLSNTNGWITVTNVTLTQPLQYWDDISTDTTQPGNPRKFYRVLPGQ